MIAFIANCIQKFKINFKKNKLAILTLLITILLGIIYLFPQSFASLTPVKSIEINSEKLNYEEKVPGAFKVTKSAEWTKKDEAEIIFDVESIQKINYEYTDVIFVLDISDSMKGEKLEKVKSDTIGLINKLLQDNNNKAALITFETDSVILSNFTNEKDSLINSIKNLQTGDMTNYYQALKNVDNILKKYKKEANRECVILFLTDGYSNEDIPSEIGEYNYLKSQYPFITINGIQYEMGDEILEPIKMVSDNQYIANMETLNNILLEAYIVGVKYNKFVLTDYIESDYFYLEDEKDIYTDSGIISFDKENQKIIWSLDDYESGKKVRMKLNVKLKLNLESGIYPTNKKENLESDIEGVKEVIEVNKTPILSSKYTVKYDSNAPDECTPTSIPTEKQHFVFDTVEVSSNVPKCTGYQFKGWKVVTDNVTQVNEDFFIMPEKDVIYKAMWGKINLKKSMTGTIDEGLTLYKQIQNDMNESSKNVMKYTGDTSTFKGDKDIYYYYGAATNNNVIFANYCWKIVRTTTTGGVKLIYNGLPKSGRCSNTGSYSILTKTQMNSSSNYVAYNTSSNSLAYLGYMYNNAYVAKTKKLEATATYKFGNSFNYSNGLYNLSNTKDITGGQTSTLGNRHYTCFNETGICDKINFLPYAHGTDTAYLEISNGKSMEDALEEMLHANDVNNIDSTMKTYVDYWYSKNMTNFTHYLEDAVWCNDRTIISWETSSWNPNSEVLYPNTLAFASNREDNILTCSHRADQFTVSSENGNGALTYPVGLITDAEHALSYVEKKTYLNIGIWYWTMSPYNSAYMNLVNKDGGNAAGSINNVYQGGGVRPMVSLRSGIEFSNGNGSADSPYIIITN